MQGTAGLRSVPAEAVPVLPGGARPCRCRCSEPAPLHGDPAGLVPLPCPGSGSRGSPEPRSRSSRQVSSADRAWWLCSAPLPSCQRLSAQSRLRSPRALCSLLQLCAGSLGAAEPPELCGSPSKGTKPRSHPFCWEMRDTLLCFPQQTRVCTGCGVFPFG